MSTRSLLAAQDPRQERAFCATLLEMTQGETQEPDPLVGTLVGGKYRIVKQLGEGGMGCVYLAEQQLGSTARKVARQDAPQAPLPRSGHQGALRSRGGHRGGRSSTRTRSRSTTSARRRTAPLYLVMEFVQGRSVADILEKDGPMPAARVENILRQVCGSLEEAHGARHRAPRSQAGQRRAVRARRSEGLGRGPRLRHREALERARSERGEAHAAGHGARHASVHEPGAVHRSAGRRAQRHLRPRRHGLRDAHR